jgi:hypothetical protein
MIKHIVMWTIHEGETPRARFERMAEVKARILGLKEVIPEIVSMEILFNSPVARGDNYDVVLTSEFRSWADLDTYLKHPVHVAVGEYIKNVKKSRAAIDYEFETNPPLLNE